VKTPRDGAHQEVQDALPGLAHVIEPRGRVISPKRPATETSGLADIFPYYAGFAFDWAYKQLRDRELAASALVLDPWNGSGTTTLAAQCAGYRSIGVDLNPVANVVAQLRCLAQVDTVSFPTPHRATAAPTGISADDPLGNWFTTRVIARLRDWTRLFSSIDPLSSSLGYVSVFRAVRELTGSFGGTNPTWVKRAKTPDELIDLVADTLDGLIDQERKAIVGRLGDRPDAAIAAAIATASSRRLPIADQSVDFILTSPPYLTRIDYAVAYSRELAVLGINTGIDRTLRSALMGTTLIRHNVNKVQGFGYKATSLLENIHSHDSKASKGYYYKQACQYLTDLAAGLDEATRVAKPDSIAILVVQDSYYKDVHVPLADICIEEAELRGWELEDKDPYPVKRLLTSLNTSARAYKKGDVVESVVRIRKKSN
jgi:DNA modification methylase